MLLRRPYNRHLADCPPIDLATAADLRHYAIPENTKRLEALESQKRADDASKGMDLDSVTTDAIAEIVAKWTGKNILSRLQHVYHMLMSLFA